MTTCLCIMSHKDAQTLTSFKGKHTLLNSVDGLCTLDWWLTGMGSSACYSLFLLQCHLKALQPFCSALELRTDAEWLPCFCPSHITSLCTSHHRRPRRGSKSTLTFRANIPSMKYVSLKSCKESLKGLNKKSHWTVGKDSVTSATEEIVIAAFEMLSFTIHISA